MAERRSRTAEAAVSSTARGSISCRRSSVSEPPVGIRQTSVRFAPSAPFRGCSLRSRALVFQISYGTASVPARSSSGPRTTWGGRFPCKEDNQVGSIPTGSTREPVNQSSNPCAQMFSTRVSSNGRTTGWSFVTVSEWFRRLAVIQSTGVRFSPVTPGLA